MAIKTLEWIDNKLRLIDQTMLPEVEGYIECQTKEEVFEAIQQMRVRGAPAIGIAAAFGVVLGLFHSQTTDYRSFRQEAEQVIHYLRLARPTAVNLFNALNRMQQVIEQNKNMEVADIKIALLTEAKMILEDEKRASQQMGDFGAQLLPQECTILTHCNAGALATAEYGTALAVIYRAVEQGKIIKVYADETRPLLQGARLTCWELMRAGIDVTLICDNMAASLMRKKLIDYIFVGADRIARNGDTANKIGTYNLAVLAKYHGIPFYIVAPTSTIDNNIPDGEYIPIEERAPEEITQWGNRRIAPNNVKVYNPAFDVTPAALITGWITEEGLRQPPFT
ncbi:MAG: S-methyl-5-thioribose-1-phosphate isomerase [bacterium]|nr:S-methyl-5-thioribose-1-phosphate isomerase [bacterium]